MFKIISEVRGRKTFAVLVFPLAEWPVRRMPPKHQELLRALADKLG